MTSKLVIATFVAATRFKWLVIRGSGSFDACRAGRSILRDLSRAAGELDISLRYDLRPRRGCL
jgi:hypothetical protein